jgi:membrane associated rhomboid family serine protease
LKKNLDREKKDFGSLKDFQTKEKQMQSELWNCVSLTFGANIGPSLKYKYEFWRIFTCFFIHENFHHLVFNAIIILFYNSNFSQKHKNKFYLFLFFNILNANLTSNILNPNFLKIGSSLLSSIFITLSFLENHQKKNFQFFIDLFLFSFIILGVFNSSVDNIVHFFGIFTSLFYWSLKDKKYFIRFYLLGSFLYSLVFLFLIFGSKYYKDDLIVVDLNYGCPNSFLDLIFLNN